MTAIDAELDAEILAFYAADAAVLVGRSYLVSGLTAFLRGDDVWRDAGDTRRRKFAARVMFARWLIRQGFVGRGDCDA